MPTGYSTGQFIWNGQTYPNEAALREAMRQEREQAEKQQIARGVTVSRATPAGSTYAVDPSGGISFQGSVPRQENASLRGLRTQQSWEGGIDPQARALAFEEFNRPQREIPRVASPTINADAARAAAFARAKDRAGSIARSSLNALYDIMAGTGRSGSNIEAGMASSLLSGAAGDLGEVSREQAIQEAALGQQTAERAYQGEVAQRGQDIDQDLARQQYRLRLLQSLY